MRITPLYKLAKDLDGLGVEGPERRVLIENCYSCLGRTLGFNSNLKDNIKVAYEKNLYGKDAYKFLEKKIKQRDETFALNFIGSNFF